MEWIRKAAIVALIMLFTSVAVARGGSVRVRGYTRKDGTYVAPHYRSAPDGNFSNNWSTRGNVNPYTGKPGTRTQDGSSGGRLPMGSAPSRGATANYGRGLESQRQSSGRVSSGAAALDSSARTSLPLIQNPNGTGSLACDKEQAAWSYFGQQLETARQNNMWSWEAQSKYHEVTVEWLTCIVQGHRAYIHTLERDYNAAAQAFNELNSGSVAELVNARVTEVQDAYATCDKAVPHPDEKGICLAEGAIWRCTQSNAKRFFEFEQQRPGGAWGHVFRAITSGSYERKLALQACQLKEAESAIEWCAGKVRRDEAPIGGIDPTPQRTQSSAVASPKPKRKFPTFAIPPGRNN